MTPASSSRWVPSSRDMLLGFALHVGLGSLLGYGTILPFELPSVSLFEDPPIPSALAEYGWEVIILSFLLPYLCRRDLAGRDALWLDRTDWSLVLVLMIAAFMLSIVADFAIEGLMRAADTSPDGGIVERLKDSRRDPLSFILYAVCLSLIGPVVEELVFRGWLYAHLRAHFTAVPTILLTGALFGLLHGGPPSYAASVVASGLIYGALRERTGGIVTSTATHVLNNTIVALGVL